MFRESMRCFGLSASVGDWLGRHCASPTASSAHFKRSTLLASSTVTSSALNPLKPCPPHQRFR